jgi:hypothetical protein
MGLGDLVPPGQLDAFFSADERGVTHQIRMRTGRRLEQAWRHGSEDQSHQPPIDWTCHRVTTTSRSSSPGEPLSWRGSGRLDVSGALVGAGDIGVQIDQVVSNAAIALAAVGAQPGQVVRSVVYVVSDDTAVLAAAWRPLTGSVIAPAFTTASTLLGACEAGSPGPARRNRSQAALFG